MKTITRRLPLFAAVALGATALVSHAAPQSFDFKDPKGVNNVQFSLDAPLESITGTANGISGAVEFDPAQPDATRGRIVLDAASLTVGNPVMREHLHGDNWLAVAAHPQIVFEANGAGNVRSDGARILADVRGRLTVKGVTKDVVVPVTFTHLPDKLGARLGDPKVKGDLLVLRANFVINRSEFGIQPGQNADKVAENIELALSIAGAAPRG
jgi:polyisoprenoid-binding protein YceI